MKCMMVFALSLIATETFAQSWDSANDPSNFERDYEYHFSALPLAGALPADQTPWSETYWPSFQGSINYRWNSPGHESFGYYSPSKEQVASMSHDQLAQLSPAEKYDLAMGHYDYPLKREVYRHASPRAPDWVGICHGWAPAALQYREPKTVEIKNPDGITIPFGSSDVKGLLSYFIAFHASENVVFAGLRCKMMGACDDINPGAMHVILANELGLRGRGLVADVSGGREVWNQPVSGYQIVPVASVYTKTAASAVQVNLIMTYSDELENSQWLPTNGTPFSRTAKMTLSYTLDLDAEGKITGGRWVSQSIPDFFWKPTRLAPFEGVLAGLAQIYQPN